MTRNVIVTWIESWIAWINVSVITLLVSEKSLYVYLWYQDRGINPFDGKFQLLLCFYTVYDFLAYKTWQSNAVIQYGRFIGTVCMEQLYYSAKRPAI